MLFTPLLAIIGALAVTLALVFPRPPRKPKGDQKFYAPAAKVIFLVTVVNQIDRALQDFFGIRLFKPNTK
jgi:hypothetical protein